MSLSWIEELLDETSESESPEQYIYWSGLASIAATVNKSVWWDKFTYKLYPNVYVFLVGDSGLRKGFPVNVARELVEKVNCTRVLAGRGSIQGVVKELGRAYTLNDGTILKEAFGFVCSGEFSSFLIKDPDALTILTDLFDCHFNPNWRNVLKSVPVDQLKDVCLSILGASNEIHLPEIIPDNAIGGGFIARTFIIHAAEKRGANSLMFAPKKKLDLDKLVTHLQVLKKLKGAFAVEDKARKYHDEWYRDFTGGHKHDKTGVYERIHDGILKVAMLLSLSDRYDLVVTQKHLEQATMSCLETLKGTKKIIMGSGKSDYSDKTRVVLKYLLKREGHTCTRKQLLSYGWGEFDAIDLDRMIETLTQSGALTANGNGKEIRYKLTDHALGLFKRFDKEAD